jgi:sugar-specific transcriptional regulator TrmB
MENLITRITNDFQSELDYVQSNLEILNNGSLSKKLPILILHSSTTVEEMDTLYLFIVENMKLISFHKPKNDFFREFRIVFNDDSEFIADTIILTEYLYSRLYQLT